MEALVAISSILFLFWPLILFFGFWDIFSHEKTLAEKVKIGSYRVFFSWAIWAGFISILYWQGRQPIIFIYPGYNEKLFLITGMIFGILTIGFGINGWLKRRIHLSMIREVQGLQELSPRAFEKLVAKIFQAYGYQTRLSEKSSDHGIDIVVTTDDLRF
ncbi:MAG: restriction endonuclease [Bacteroidales bacterium]